MARGGKRAGAGRKKGSQSQVTLETRELFKKVLDNLTPELERWLIETGDGIEIEKQMPNGETVVGRLNADPGKAADLLLRLSERFVPKLAQLDVTVVQKMSDEELLKEVERRAAEAKK